MSVEIVHGSEAFIHIRLERVFKQNFGEALINHRGILMLEGPILKGCKHCGNTKVISDFDVQSGRPASWCKPCVRAYQKEYRDRNKGRVKAYKKVEWKKYKHLRYYTKRKLKQWGMTIEDLEMAFERQEGCCAICRKKFLRNGGRGVNMDHCHKENKFRGILCTNCNMGLGAFKENPDLLVVAAKYLCS